MKRTALVTGGARGIGKAIADNLAADHNVAIVWKSTEPKGMPEGVLSIQADLTEDGATDAVVKQVIEAFGTLDIIVNNAGLVHSTPKDAFNAAAAREILDVNTLVPAMLLQSALPHLKSGASIINISSGNAVLPPRDASIYGASKAALNLWTKAMAKELGPKGIRVNAVAPGATEIPEAPRSEELIGLFVKDTALGRMGQPDDIAKAVRFFAGDQSSFVTGEILGVSGGYRI